MTTFGVGHALLNFLNSNAALVPPKPNEFDSA
jgi:hypothetical protein